MSKSKFGAGHMAAMARLGLKELRNAANPSRESVADTEIGLYGTLTQGEIAEAREGPGTGREQESRRDTFSLAELRRFADQKAKEAEHRMEHQNDHQRQHGGIER